MIIPQNPSHHLGIGVMMRYEPADSFRLCVSETIHLCQNLSGFCGSQFLLVFAMTVAVFGFGSMDAHVMKDGGSLQYEKYKFLLKMTNVLGKKLRTLQIVSLIFYVKPRIASVL